MSDSRFRPPRFWPASVRHAALSALIICLVLALPASAARQGALHPAPATVPGEILIGWQPGKAAAGALAGAGVATARSQPLSHGSAAWQAAADALAAQTGRTVIDVQPAFGFARLAVPAGAERAEMARLAALPWVRYAEPNYRVNAAAIPNDPYFPDQWNMTRVSAPQAWNVTMGLGLITVAVIDSGVDFTHADLAGRLRSGGVNYIAPGQPPQDDNGHGTHVAGIIAANTNNGLGVAGMAGQVMILPFKILDANGSGNIADMATAIYAAISSAGNAQIINVSAGAANLSPGTDTTLHNAVKAARQAGVLVVAAAGNYGSASDGNPLYYPAAYSEALAVAASDANDGHPDYSGHQPYVGLAAPGGSQATKAIVSTYWPNTYASLYGTSMATAMVSGAAALTLAVSPTMTVDDLVFTLEHTADKVGPYAYGGGRNDYFGYGRLNVWSAVAPLRLSTRQVSLVSDGATQSVMVAVTLQSLVDQPAAWSISKTAGQPWLFARPATGTLDPLSATSLVIGAFTCGVAPGAYDGSAHIEITSPPHGSLDVAAHLQLVGGQRCVTLPAVAR